MLNLRNPNLHANAIIEALNLSPHPEGGHYREVWRHSPPDGRRGVATSILFLLEHGQRSHWHRVDAAEIWLWQAGAALALHVEGHPSVRLGPDLDAGDSLQATVPAHAWQAAEPCGAWSLVSCIVAPAFSFNGFELAPEGWAPA
jgi:uncharacterized protein